MMWGGYPAIAWLKESPVLCTRVTPPNQADIEPRRGTYEGLLLAKASYEAS